MLIQKDYIIVDLNTDCGNWYLPMGEGDTVCQTNGLSNKVGGKMGSLDFTIQCNGKLKKHRAYFEIIDNPPTENKSGSRDLVRWEGVTEAISMLCSLGYELDIFEIQKRITNELNGCCDNN